MTARIEYEDRGGRKYEKPDSRVDFNQLSADWDKAHWQIRDSDLEKHADELSKALGKLTSQVEKIAKVMENDLARLATPTGLTFSITALAIFGTFNRGVTLLSLSLYLSIRLSSPKFSASTGRPHSEYSITFEYSGVANLEDLEGVTQEIADRIRRFFRVESS